jgi:hypothetical protein
MALKMPLNGMDPKSVVSMDSGAGLRVFARDQATMERKKMQVYLTDLRGGLFTPL